MAEFKKDKDVVVLGVFGGADDKEFKAFEQAAAQHMSDFDFGHSFDVAIVEEV